MSQTDIFIAGEGDRYFTRNAAAYTQSNSASIPAPIRFYGSHIRPGGKILEIGCSNGVNLAYLDSLVRCECFGIDPSREAIEDGRRRFPGVSLSVGTSERLPFPRDAFDVLLFGFCLYLVDRSLLAETVAEADRVLRSPGFLGITDFDMAVPTVRPYKHMAGVSSYKMDYSRLFTAYPHYSLAGKISFSHSGQTFHSDPDERVAATLLYKDAANAYRRAEDAGEVQAQ